VVNTHSHGDHTFGNFVFPEAVIVAHEHTRTQAADVGLYLTTLWPDVHWGDIEIVLPEVTYRDRMTLHLGDLVVELHHLGPAHATDDTVVWLPDQRVLFAGDLIMSGVTPFVMMGSVSGLRRATARLREFEPAVVVPGHGPVGGPELLDATERYLSWVCRLAKTGVAEDLSPSELARQTDLGEFADLIDSERLLPNLYRAYAEERGGVPGEPMDIAELFGSMVEFHGGLPACHV
jgi:cyclase